MSIIKKDSFLLGGLIGLLLPVAVFFLLQLIKFALFSGLGNDVIVTQDKLMLISLFFNLLALRYYLVSLKFDKTGRGILLLTFVLGLLYFIFVHNKGIVLIP